MNRPTVVALGLLAIAVLGLVCVFGHKGRIETDLTERALAALSSQKIEGVVVSAEGRDLTLSGLVASMESLERAGSVANSVRGVRAVRNDLQLRPLASRAYELTARLRGAGLVLSGQVPDESTRAELIAAASDLVGSEKVTDELAIVPGSAAPGWPRAARSALRQLAALQEGELQLQGRRLVLSGRAQTADIAERVRMAVESEMPAGYQAKANLTVETELAPLDALSCQRLFDEALRGNRIVFATASARLDPGSYQLLDRLVQVAGRCPETTIEVAGHTDSQGAAELNLSLSQRRAESVRLYLLSQGIAADRVLARGYGESQPVADNASASGRARNRRIEFRIK